MTSTFHLAAIRTMPRRNAFTLVELLVCITIIAILLAIQLPAIGMARAAVNQNGCAGTQRMLFQALRVYQTDNNGLGPHRWPNSSSNTYADGLTFVPGPASSPMSGADVWGIYDTYSSISDPSITNVTLGLGMLADPGQPYTQVATLFDPSCIRNADNRWKHGTGKGADSWSVRYTWTFGAPYDLNFYSSSTPGWDGTLNKFGFLSGTANNDMKGDYAYRTGDFGYTTSLGQVGIANPGVSRANLAYTRPESVIGGGTGKAILADDYSNQHVDVDGVAFNGDTYNVTFADGSTITVKGIQKDMATATANPNWTIASFWLLQANLLDTQAGAYEEDLPSHSSRRGGRVTWLNNGTISRVATSAVMRTGMFDKIEQLVQSRGQR